VSGQNTPYIQLCIRNKEVWVVDTYGSGAGGKAYILCTLRYFVGILELSHKNVQLHNV
jgi:hypothetical protein